MKSTGPAKSLLFFVILTAIVSLSANELGQDESTTVTSDRLELLLGDDENKLIFSGAVVIISRDLQISTDRLSVWLARDSESSGDFGPTGAIRRMEAQGNVVILQADRRATCGRATILPKEGRVILDDSPEIFDGQNRVRGYRIVFHEEDGRIEVEPGPEGQRPKVIIEPQSVLP